MSSCAGRELRVTAISSGEHENVLAKDSFDCVSMVHAQPITLNLVVAAIAMTVRSMLTERAGVVPPIRFWHGRLGRWDHVAVLRPKQAAAGPTPF